MTADDKDIQNMIANIQDEKLRVHYQSLIGGALAFVKCMSKHCKGAKIGELTATGQWVNTCRNSDGGRMQDKGLRSTRLRFDGATGFACRCGNSSILSPAEEGVINSGAPTRNELAKVFERQQTNQAKVINHKDGTKEIDGFVIVEVRSTN